VDVFLVPLAGDRYELYAETGGSPAPDPAAAEPRGWRKRLMDRFHTLIHDAEAENDTPNEPEARRGLWGFVVRRIAEAVVEQRLLWHLRGETTARLLIPDDLDPDAGARLAREAFARDASRHLRWCAIDSALLLLCAPLTLIPGPNLPAFYFAFRVVGHALAFRGATRGRDRIAWNVEPRAALTAVRTAQTLGDAFRTAAIDRAAHDLGLARLAAFLARVDGVRR
jgi:hypothetical protein